jgi:hypothetical protein
MQILQRKSSALMTQTIDKLENEPTFALMQIPYQQAYQEFQGSHIYEVHLLHSG